MTQSPEIIDSAPKPPNGTGRIAALDGLRGMASLAVVATHIISAMYPSLYVGYGYHAGYEMQDRIARSPFFVFYSGMFAVFVFFVLSGYVLSQSVTRSKSNVFVLMIRRYIRLTVPIAASILFARTLLLIWPDAAQKLAHTLVFQSWGYDYQDVSRMYQLGASRLGVAINEITHVIYMHNGSYFDPPLWTMQVELVGSYAVYIFYRAVVSRWRFVILAALGMTLVNCPNGWWSNLTPFVAGAMLWELASRGFMPRWRIGIVLFLFGLYLGGAPRAGIGGTWVLPFANLVAPFGYWYSIVLSLGAASLVAGTIMCDWVRKLLEMRIPRYLGRISFSLYLVHFPLLGTFFAAMYYRLNEPGRWTSGHLAAVISIPVYVAVTFVCATLLAVAVDEPLLKLLSGKWQKTVISPVREAQAIPVSVTVVDSVVGVGPVST